MLPFSLLLDFTHRVKQWLHDKGIRKTVRFHTNVMAVGNLSLGGTGKSLMIDYLIRFFRQSGIKPAVLGRGYGRSTRGFRMVNAGEDAQTVGDAAYMHYLKHEVPVAVAGERQLAIPELLLYAPEADVVLLEDAFQFREISSSPSILLTSYYKPFFEDYLFPGGTLKEARHGAARADMIVMTRCPPSLTDADQVKLKTAIAKYSQAPVFFTTVAYGVPRPFFEDTKPFTNRAVGICGISGHQLFYDHLQRNFSCKLLHRYNSHHRYTARDVKDIIMELDETVSLLTTGRDMAKLRRFNALRPYRCYYLPVEIKFLKNEALFQSGIESALKNHAHK